MDKEIRLDKWLWVARFYKTRSIAKQAIDGGKVRVNSYKVKPGKNTRVGDAIELRQGLDEKTVIVKDIANKRESATEAIKLYYETPESIAKREKKAMARRAAFTSMRPPETRPNKKERRDIKRFKSSYDV